jgi:hypothetical protein
MKAILFVLLAGASGCAFAQSGVGGGGEHGDGKAPVCAPPPHSKPTLTVSLGSQPTSDKANVRREPSMFDWLLRMLDIIDRRRQ